MAQYEYQFLTEGSGSYINDLAAETITKHALCYFDPTGNGWLLADADAAATMPVVGISMAAIPTTRKGRFLLKGFIGDGAWTWTPNGIIYASTTPGQLTQTPPAGAGDTVQAVGIARSSTIIWFDPAGFGGSDTPDVTETSYIVYNDGTTTYAKNGTTGFVDFSGTDSVVVIESAINALTSGRTWKETVTLKGSFSFASQLDVPSYTIIKGTDCLITNSFDNGSLDIISVEGTVGADVVQIEVRDLVISQGAGNCRAGIFVDYAQFVDLDNISVTLTNNGSVPITIGFSEAEFRVENCHVINSYATGGNNNPAIELAGAKYSSLRNSRITGAATHGVAFSFVDYCLCENNVIDDVQLSGLYIANSTHCNYVGNKIFDTVQNGIVMVTTSSNNVIDGNIIESAGQHGINLFANLECVVTNNVIDEPTLNGIYVSQSGANNQNISNNTIKLSGDHGIECLGSIINIVDNGISRSGEHGVLLTNTTQVDITGNTIVDSSWSGGGTYDGIKIDGANSEHIVISSNQMKSSGRTPLYDIELADAGIDTVIIIGNTLTKTTNSIRVLGTNIKINLNSRFVTENSGTSTINSGSTSVAVVHGLSFTPTVDEIQVTLNENPTNDPGNIWVDTIGAANFTVNCRNDPGVSNLDFGWKVTRT